MAETLELTAEGRLEALSTVAERTAAFLESCGCSAETIFKLQFALEELFSNIVQHAYDGDTASHTIGIGLECDDARTITLTMEDDGRTFDPLSAPVPDTTLPIDQRPIGGLGLFITQRLASSIDYRRSDGKNRVSVRFMRSPGDDATPAA